MKAIQKNTVTKSLVGASLSLLLLGAGGMLLNPASTYASTTTTSTSEVSSSSISASKADAIINTAESYIGKVNYQYGTRDTQHLIMDCSAFTQFVFAKNGISIPWGSQAQSSVGTKVSSKSSLKKGDLVLFSVGTPGKIGHAGIYIGNGKFISNTTSSGVVIADMNSGYWQNRFIVGRRL